MFSWLKRFLCGSPCVDCCCPTEGGCLCETLPESLTAEFFYAGGGGSATVITLTKISDHVWTGSGNIGETPFTFELTCDADGPSDDGSIGPTMSGTIDCGGGPQPVTQVLTLCLPIEWQGSMSVCDLESVTVTE